MSKVKSETASNLRSPIVILLAHVDHGKTSILDSIRGSAVAAGEAGGITQAIGASIIPLETIKKMCGGFLEKMKIDLKLPGLLFIDSPGHAAFSNIRKRGGNLADIAILVVDINEGLRPQTIESIEILKNYKTPFIVAANKIDLISGWKGTARETGTSFLASFASQSEQVKQVFETKLYELVGALHEHGFESERFDRVSDYTKQLVIVPISAKTKEGLPELLMSLAGLTQKFMLSCLNCDTSGEAKGTIIEVKEAQGLGVCLDVILYDGSLKRGDTIVFGTMDEPKETKIRALLEPKPLSEMRDKKTKFNNVSTAFAATGVKISAPGLELACAGMPIVSCKSTSVEDAKEEIRKEIAEVLIETGDEGIIVKADTLGSLEALIGILRDKNIPIRRADIGNVNKKDITSCQSTVEKDPMHSVILGFNVVDASGFPSEKAKIIANNVIYKLIEDFESWQEEVKKRLESAKLDAITMPCKIELLKGYLFRQNNPAVIGCEVLSGKLKVGMPLMNKNGERVTEVKSMQLEKESVSEAEKGKQIAVAFPNVTVGRQINEGDILFSYISEDDFKKLKELKAQLSKEDVEVIKEIAEIMRKENSLWGI